MNTHNFKNWVQTAVFAWFLTSAFLAPAASLEAQFENPPPNARPWVYWYFMDGNLTREGLTADLEAMREAGIGGAIFLEVDLGVPRGPVRFMSPEWRALFAHAVHEAERLGIEIVLGSGPGWCGTGGPWVQPDQSMQHLVASETQVSGPASFSSKLPRPQPRAPFFGEGTLTPEAAKQWREFYRDVAVLAFPTPDGNRRLADVDEKALYKRAPYSSSPGVASSLPMRASYPSSPAQECIAPKGVLDLTKHLQPDGTLNWEVPAGHWTILRFARTPTGQMTRPAPMPGLGFETDKFNPAALDAHFQQFNKVLLKEIGRRKKGPGGLTTLHFDSWEMSSQNWSENFRAEFLQRRGYDPLPFLPAYTGRIVGSEELTERFLWDLRQTAQELVIANHVSKLRDFAHRDNLAFSMEPYDMNPNSDLSLGAVADVPMCEFWWLGFETSYSVIEAASIAHTAGRQIVAAEAFTSNPGEDWRAHPANIKSLGDWAFAAGVNRIAFHRYQHQPWLDRRPGLRMGPYGVHWERTQTWWPMVSAYHTYLARCQFLLRQGQSVADILYLAPEGAPHVFRAPPSAVAGDPPDRRGYNFDGCAPDTLITRAKARHGQIIFPKGSSYRLLVLPEAETMTPTLLHKLKDLLRAGITIVGPPPKKSPSLSGYPNCDLQVQELAAELWNPKPGSPARRILWNDQLAASISSLSGPQNPLEGAQWIWTDEGDPTQSAALGTRYFRLKFDLPATSAIQTAVLHLTSDNGFILSVNGTEAGRGDNFHRLFKFDVKKHLVSGANQIDVAVENSGKVPNPAGLIGSLSVKMQDGREPRWHTSSSWTASRDAKAHFQPARELGIAGIPPWGSPALSGEQIISVAYPGYDAAASLLSEQGLHPDFETDGPIRYTHRRDRGTDIYFVANRSEQPIDATCFFRVTERQPELWHPVTGRQRPLTALAAADDRTSLRLHFDPLESYFIVFRKPARPRQKPQPNFPTFTKIQDVSGPWELAFDPQWGGPERVTFKTLEDWSSRPEPGIRHYSGITTYRKEFQWDNKQNPGSNQRLFLDLGEVKNMARVRLNGRDLGIVWCPPWRVEVTSALQPGLNHLHVEVANLWINRLIADAGLPEAKRLTWTSSNPYQPNSPLSPSGLLGPVVIQSAQP